MNMPVSSKRGGKKEVGVVESTWSAWVGFFSFFCVLVCY